MQARGGALVDVAGSARMAYGPRWTGLAICIRCGHARPLKTDGIALLPLALQGGGAVVRR